LRIDILSHYKKIHVNQIDALVDAKLPNPFTNRAVVSGMPISSLEVGREMHPVPLLP